MEFINSDDPRAMIKTSDDSEINYYPTNLFSIPMETGAQTVVDKAKSVDFEVKKSSLFKNELVVLDILATNNWKRPVYFLSTQVPRSLGFENYLQLDGFAYRLVPGKSELIGEFPEAGRINADSLYDKLMNRFKWGNMNNPKIFLDYNTLRTTNILGIRSCFSRLADEYSKQGNREKAIRVLDRCQELMPNRSVPYDFFMLPVIRAYYNAGDTVKAKQISDEYRIILEKELEYYNSLGDHWKKGVDYERRYADYIVQEINQLQ
jgi:tetratricopeptide (TPR) repeat protein